MDKQKTIDSYMKSLISHFQSDRPKDYEAMGNRLAKFQELKECIHLADDHHFLEPSMKAFEKSANVFRAKEKELRHAPTVWEDFFLRMPEPYENSQRENQPAKELYAYCVRGKKFFDDASKQLDADVLGYRKEIEEMLQNSRTLKDVTARHPELAEDKELMRSLQKIVENVQSILKNNSRVFQESQEGVDKHPFLSVQFVDASEKILREANSAFKAANTLITRTERPQAKLPDFFKNAIKTIQKRSTVAAEKTEQLSRGIAKPFEKALESLRTFKSKEPLLATSKIQQLAYSRVKEENAKGTDVMKAIEADAKQIGNVAKKIAKDYDKAFTPKITGR